MSISCDLASTTNKNIKYSNDNFDNLKKNNYSIINREELISQDPMHSKSHKISKTVKKTVKIEQTKQRKQFKSKKGKLFSPYIKISTDEQQQGFKVVNVECANQIPEYSFKKNALSISSKKLRKVTADCCSFCGKPRGDAKLGDLFGPYMGEDENSPELWTHEDCAVWTNGVYVTDGSLHGLIEAVAAAKNKKCHLCKFPGATLSCAKKSCKQFYHYSCAIECNFCFNEDNFTILCNKHKK